MHHFLKIIGWIVVAVVIAIVICVIGFFHQVDKDGWEQ